MANVSLSDVLYTINVGAADIPDVKLQKMVKRAEVTLELGKEPPQLSDYLYGLRTFTVNVEKLSHTKLGKRGIPNVTQSGGVGAHHVSHEAGLAFLSREGEVLMVLSEAGDLHLKGQLKALRVKGG